MTRCNIRLSLRASAAGWVERSDLAVGRLLAAIAVSLLACFGPAHATANPAAPCRALLQESFAGLPDAPTLLVSADAVSASADLPGHCLIEAYVARQVGVQVRLPLQNWNGKFLMQGCGGSCGIYSTGACDDALARGYAVSTTDMGHKGGEMSSWHWAFNAREAEIDFGYRATHVAAVASKALIKAFYGNGPRYSYFRGCSTGGRQGLVEAQRFPHDFDGIIAGAPPLDETGDGALHLLWSARAAIDRSLKPLITAAEVDLVHRAVIKACDMLDGLDDGIIQDPTRCTWDPVLLACSRSRSDECLSTAAVEVVRKIYDGARDSRGRKLLRGGGMPRGSEYAWVPIFIGDKGQPSPLLAPGDFGDQFLGYLGFYDDPGPGYSSLSFDWDRDPQRLALMEALFSARNPDLRDYRDRGGKILLYWGWDDVAISAGQGIDYYQTVTALMGGEAQTRQFFRLFMVPGMGHCRRGRGEVAIDYLTYMENWVELRQAPDSLLGYHPKNPLPFAGIPPVRFPLSRDEYEWSRPVYAYPDVAAWTGKRDWKDPAAWVMKQRIGK